MNWRISMDLNLAQMITSILVFFLIQSQLIKCFLPKVCAGNFSTVRRWSIHPPISHSQVSSAFLKFLWPCDQRCLFLKGKIMLFLEALINSCIWTCGKGISEAHWKRVEKQENWMKWWLLWVHLVGLYFSFCYHCQFIQIFKRCKDFALQKWT